MGEFAKLIDGLKQEKDFVNWGWGTEAIKIIEKQIGEAKKEFPKKKCIGVRIDGDGEEYNEYGYDEQEVDDYKKKWFGSDKE